MESFGNNSVVRRWLKAIGCTFFAWMGYSTFLTCGAVPGVGEVWMLACVPVVAAFLLGVAVQFHDSPRGPFSSIGGCIMTALALGVVAFLSFLNLVAAAVVADTLGYSVPAWVVL